MSVGFETTRAGHTNCSSCGKIHPAPANFCPYCGTPRDVRVADPGVKSPKRRRLERHVSEHLLDDWTVDADFGDRVVLTKRRYGSPGVHFLVALLTLWWTLGIGNALYAAFVYFGEPDRKVLDADELALEHTAAEPPSPWTTRLTIAAAWLAAVVLFAGGSGSVVTLGLGVAFALFGVALLPPVRHRLLERHPVTTNGRTRSVDERPVTDPGERCTACFTDVYTGIERTYRDEFVLAGVPLRRYRNGTNVYCHRCALERDSPPSIGKKSDDVDRTQNRRYDHEHATDTDVHAGTDTETV